jgi:hypothetical protein
MAHTQKLQKNGMIGVIIHEVGHNFFPMIINSDERQWSWLDEGLNTFVEYLTEELWDNKFPSKRGPAFTITDYMRLPKDQLEPIMTNSQNIIQFGPNAYSKPATGLNILRETIMGRELFDFAFKQYTKRWAFKHPEPADFFRTMEDASGEDLDWFWRGWFFSTDPCDIALDSVKYATYDNTPPKERSFQNKPRALDKPLAPSYDDISKVRNRNNNKIVFATDADTSLRDFYWRYVRGIEPYDTTKYLPNITNAPIMEPMDIATQEKYANTHLYEITFVNKGGLVMPIIVEFTLEDGSKQTERIPAQIWRKNEHKVTKVFMTPKKATSITLDPLRETADIDESNNTWNDKDGLTKPSRFTIFKGGAFNRRNAGGSQKKSDASCTRKK